MVWRKRRPGRQYSRQGRRCAHRGGSTAADTGKVGSTINIPPSQERAAALYVGTRSTQTPFFPPFFERSKRSATARRCKQPNSPPPSTGYERARRFASARRLPSGKARLLTCICPPRTTKTGLAGYTRPKAGNATVLRAASHDQMT